MPRMLAALQHRGPDAEGMFRAPGLELGHRRLKILDMSDLANQPYTDGTDALVFNGRIFNYLALRRQLSDRFSFQTDCDTEVLFRALQVWGRAVFEHIEGQFAFGFYDASAGTLMLARDHAGIFVSAPYGRTLLLQLRGPPASYGFTVFPEPGSRDGLLPISL